MKKRLLIGGSIFLLLLMNSLCFQPSQADENENPRYHHDVKLIIISRVFDSIEINGFHDENNGIGFDELIQLEEANSPRLFGFLKIYNDSIVFEQNYHGGWIHTNIEINGFSGFMINQHTKKHVIIIGTCDLVSLTSGRG